MSELSQNFKTALQEIGELSALLFIHMTLERGRDPWIESLSQLRG
jgi:hypothetical protein